MKKLVIFDSNFGNTKKIAKTIAKELETKSVLVSDFNEKELEGVNLLIVGSPIIGWRPSERMGKLLSRLDKNQLEGVKVATFDTRVKIFFHGDAAKKIAKRLEGKGAKVIEEPEAFFVKGKEGPLLKGEIEKAKNWAEKIKKAVEIK